MQTKPEKILPKVISMVEADATHLHTFPERDKLWKHVRSSEALCELLRQLILGYVKLYMIHNKGKDKYAHFLVAWHELFSHFAVEGSDSEDAIWYALVCDDDKCPKDVEHRSAIVTSVAKAVYELLTEKESQYTKQRQGQIYTESIYPQAKESLPDDDASVIRVSGFALHSAIKYRKRNCF